MADEVTNEVNPFSNIKLEAPTDNPFANVKVEKPSKPEDYGPVAAFARGAASGLTFDWADELAAMYQAGIPDYLRGDPEAQKRYEEALAQQRKVKVLARFFAPHADISVVCVVQPVMHCQAADGLELVAGCHGIDLPISAAARTMARRVAAYWSCSSVWL